MLSAVMWCGRHLRIELFSEIILSNMSVHDMQEEVSLTVSKLFSLRPEIK